MQIRDEYHSIENMHLTFGAREEFIEIWNICIRLKFALNEFLDSLVCNVGMKH